MHAGNAQLRAQVINAAIDNVGKPSKLDFTKDPIVALFNDYLKEQNKKPLRA